MKYIGIVKDRLKSLPTRKTKKYNSYYLAQKSAERLCKKTYGERGSIDVETLDGNSRKHKVSSKVLAALARGRAKLAHSRRTKHKAQRVRHVPKSKESIIITKGEVMAGRKRRRHHKRLGNPLAMLGGRKRRRRSRGTYGFEGRRRSRRHRYYGGDMKGITGMLTGGAVAVAGGVAASMAAHAIPFVKDDKMKALIPIGIGAALAFLPMTRKNMLMQKIAMGAVVVGALSFIRHQFPTIPLLTGDVVSGDALYIPQSGEEARMLGASLNTMGEPVDVMGMEVQGEMEGEMDGEMDGE